MRGIQVFSLPFPLFLSSLSSSFLSSLPFSSFLSSLQILRGGGPLCPRTEASLSPLGGQDKNISSIFPHFLVVSHISSNCLNFLPYFGLPGGRFAHPERPWLRHCSTPYIYACLSFCQHFTENPLFISNIILALISCLFLPLPELITFTN